MKEGKLFEKSTSLTGLMLGMAAYTSSSILGPLLIFGIFGYFLDKLFDKSPLFLLLGILLAFILTNILIYKKIKRLSIKFDEQYNKEEKPSSASSKAMAGKKAMAGEEEEKTEK